jgi:hypothetical protein
MPEIVTLYRSLGPLMEEISELSAEVCAYYLAVCFYSYMLADVWSVSSVPSLPSLHSNHVVLLFLFPPIVLLF